MKKGMIVLTFFLILLLSLPNLSIAGPNDVWVVCGSGSYCSSKTIGGTTYTCCAGPAWRQATNCCGDGTVNCGEDCEPGGTQSQYCTYCNSVSCPGGGTQYCTGGTQTRSCTSTCTWGSWGSCSGGSCSCTIGQCGVGGGTTTTTFPTTTTTTTTTIPSKCPSTICEYDYFGYSEDQTSCPQDCRTNLELYANGQLVYPTTYLKPSQSVTVVVTFNDSRYNSSQGFNLELYATIEDPKSNKIIIWNESTGCKVCGKTLNSMGCTNCGKKGYVGGDWSRYDSGYEIKVHMENGFARIEFNATLPSNLIPGPQYKLKVTPILYSFPVTLKAAETQINIADGLYTFVIIIKNIFNKITGLFVYSL